jgi:hypothetical protein
MRVTTTRLRTSSLPCGRKYCALHWAEKGFDNWLRSDGRVWFLEELSR